MLTQFSMRCGILATLVFSRSNAEEQASGTHPDTVRAHCAAAAESAGQCQPLEPAGTQRHSVGGRARLQVAWPAGALRKLARCLHAHEPVVEERRSGPRVRGPAAGADDPGPGRGPEPRQHQHEGTSRRYRGSKKNGPQCIGKSRGGWNTKLHMVAADARTAVAFARSPGNAHDAPQGRQLRKRQGRPSNRPALIMDRACEDDQTRQLAVDLGFTPVVPPKSNRTTPWKYDRELYKRRNEVERLFRRLKGFRRGFSRFEKLDVMFLGFIVFALIIDALISVNTP